jgi:type IV pilus assembly protein PilF
MKAHVLSLLFISLLVTACVSNSPQLGAQDKESAAAYNLQLGIDYFSQGNLTQAKEKLDRSLVQNPKNAQAHAAAGLLYERLNELDKADQYYSRAVDLDPVDADLINLYGVFLCKRGEWARGEKLALQAANNQLYKMPEKAYFNAGTCAEDAGKLSVAEHHYERALELNQKFSFALLRLAELKLTSNDVMSARGFLDRFHSAVQATAESLWLGVRIERAAGNEQSATEYARRLKAEFASSPQATAVLDAERKK